MTKTPMMISPDSLAAEALRIMERHEISVLIAVEKINNKIIPVGMIHLHDILRAGIA